MKDKYLTNQTIKQVRLQLIYDSLLFSNLGQLFAAIILVYIFQRFISDKMIIVWFSFQVFSVVFGLLIRYLYNSHPNIESINTNYWEKLYLFAVVIASVVWGTAGIILYPQESVAYQSFLELVIAGVVAASISALSASLRASFIFIIFTLVPLSWWIYSLHQPNSLELTVLILIYLVVSLISSKKLNQSIKENLKLRFIAQEREKALKRRELKLKESEKNYKQLYKKSEQASQAKSEFLSNMSHEIRTPMNGVIGATDLLLANKLSTDQIDRANLIKNSAKSMLAIINDILDFSKIEAGKLDIELHDFNFKDFIDDFSSSIINRVKEKNLSYSLSIEDDLNIWFKGDSGRIRQILTNLIGNSIKFTKQGEINLVCKSIYKNNLYTIIQFDINDTGIGISPEQQKVIFDRFTQADGSTTRKFGGSGLGLSISKQLSELMGGEIGFNKNPEIGTSIWFTVRLVNIEMPVIIDNEHIQIKNNDKFNARALVVDDNTTNQLVAEGMLETFGLDIDIATDGIEALSCLAKHDYDLVFMDCHMPTMDGYEATAAIRNKNIDVKNHQVPIIAMTASAMTGDKEKCLASGMDDYIAKPIELVILKNKLKKWLSAEKYKLKTNND